MFHHRDINDNNPTNKIDLFKETIESFITFSPQCAPQLFFIIQNGIDFEPKFT